MANLLNVWLHFIDLIGSSNLVCVNGQIKDFFAWIISISNDWALDWLETWQLFVVDILRFLYANVVGSESNTASLRDRLRRVFWLIGLVLICWHWVWLKLKIENTENAENPLITWHTMQKSVFGDARILLQRVKRPKSVFGGTKHFAPGLWPIPP